jgi:hypothetical protein
VAELEPDYYREAHGQTMHFFSEEYCREVLGAFVVLELSHVPLQDAGGTVVKCVWRCVAQVQPPSTA